MARAPNGERYPLVGGTRLRHFDGTSSKPRKLLENAQTPTSRVHAVLGAFNILQSKWLKACESVCILKVGPVRQKTY
jgi:hypothetical protein